MIIEKLLLREGMIENLDTFSEKRNLIYSKTNTKGNLHLLDFYFMRWGIQFLICVELNMKILLRR